MPELIDYIKILYERGCKTAFREVQSRIIRENPKTSLKRLLNLLNKYNVPFTFFIVGKTAERHPELIKKIIKSQHEIGAHGYLHNRMDLMHENEIKNDLYKVIKLFRTKFQYEIQGFRAPYLKTSNKLLDLVQSLGFKWSSSKIGEKNFKYKNGLKEIPIQFDDWELLIKNRISIREMFRIIKKHLRSSNTLLLHPFRIAQKRYINHLESFIKWSQDHYKFVKLSNIKENSISLTGDIGELALFDLVKRILHVNV